MGGAAIWPWWTGFVGGLLVLSDRAYTFAEGFKAKPLQVKFPTGLSGIAQPSPVSGAPDHVGRFQVSGPRLTGPCCLGEHEPGVSGAG